MVRPLVMLVSALLLSGCQGSGALFPGGLFGPTRVPPPGTGSVSEDPSRNPYFSTPPVGLEGPSNTDGVSSAWTKPVHRDSAVRQAQAILPLEPAPPARGEEVSTRSMPGDRVFIPSSAMGASVEPAARIESISMGQVSPSVNLPAFEADFEPLAGPRGDSHIQLASATEPIESTVLSPSTSHAGLATAGGPSVSSNAARYGHHPQYEWVRGFLEHSRIDGGWKLRYIPLDGETDAFGGSVRLSRASALSDFQRGEFVEIRGRLVSMRAPEGRFSPDYEVFEIRRVEPGRALASR